MRPNRSLCLLLTLAIAAVTPAIGAPPTIDDLGWISGTWRGELFGSNAEERWTAPAANHMLGVFRMWNDEGPGVYELIEIRQELGEGDEPARVALRFKHFNPGTLESWEPDKPLEFALESVDGQRAVFTATSAEQRQVTSMIYSREDDELRVSVEGEHDNGVAFAFVAEFRLIAD